MVIWRVGLVTWRRSVAIIYAASASGSLDLTISPDVERITLFFGLNFGSPNALVNAVGSPPTLIWERLGFGCANNWRRERTYFNWGER